MDTGLREWVATACRVLAATGLVENVLGHISARHGDAVLVRCRGPREAGLAATRPTDIRQVDGNGVPDDSEWSAPSELPIHISIMARRSDVTAVVHCHPPAVVAYSLLDRELVPLYGAYDIPGARLAAQGIPRWPVSALIDTAAHATPMADCLGDQPAIVLRGHGLVTVGTGNPRSAVASAVLTALAINNVARMSLEVLRAGGQLNPIGADDLRALPDLGPILNIESMWRHLTSSLPPIDASDTQSSP